MFHTTPTIDLLPDAWYFQTDHIKRTHNYEPFLREYFTALYNEGKLNNLLGRDENGRKISATRKVKGKTKR